MTQAWYAYPRIDNFGTIDPQGAYWKPDSNILTPPGYPVTALLSGRVTSVQRTSWGQLVITVKLDKSLNKLATHTFYEHLHDALIAVGQHVQAGQLIGTANLAGEGANLGFGLYSGDVYGSGPAWQTLQNDLMPGGQGLLNPTALLDSFAGGRPGVTPLTSIINTGDGGGRIERVKQQLQPNADVTLALYALEQALLLTNPFDVSGVQQDTVAGFTFTDPMSWIQQFGQNLVDNASAFVVRLVLLILGVFVLYKIVSAFIDFGAIGDSIKNAAQLAATGAAL